MTAISAIASLAKEQWYHGLLPREDIKIMLKKNGDFLVRTSEPTPGEPRQLVLSVMHREDFTEGARHYVIQEKNGKFAVRDVEFDSIQELVEFYSSKGLLQPSEPPLYLQRPVLRQSWELNHEDIELVKKLGEGAFGEVHMGKLRLKSGEQVDVAVKVAKLETLTKEQIKEIMREARLMRDFKHKNVVRFYGVAAGQEPLMVLMELVNGGGLDSFLKKNPQTIATKADMIVQAARGLDYLHKELVIHRDIAARNCLYGDGVVKISDFGLSRQGTVYQMNPKCRVPIRWLAPETLKTSFYSQKTDVFAYGILCWEIYEDGAEPYPGMTVAEVHAKVKEGYRMSIPDAVPADIATIIKKCWSANPQDRPEMSEIEKSLNRAIKNLNGSEKQSTSPPKVKPSGEQFPTAQTTHSMPMNNMKPTSPVASRSPSDSGRQGIKAQDSLPGINKKKLSIQELLKTKQRRARNPLCDATGRQKTSNESRSFEGMSRTRGRSVTARPDYQKMNFNPSRHRDDRILKSSCLYAPTSPNARASRALRRTGSAENVSKLKRSKSKEGLHKKRSKERA